MLSSEKRRTVERSPLFDFFAQLGNEKKSDIHIEELREFRFFVLRGKSEDVTFLQQIKEATGIELPTEPKACTVNKEISCFWVSPDEWWIACHKEKASRVQEKIESVSETNFAFVDNSSGLTILRLKGENAQELMMKSCCYDFNKEVFLSGFCAQIKFARASALVFRRDETTFDLIIRRSFSDYIAKWCIEAALEYGMQVKDD